MKLEIICRPKENLDTVIKEVLGRWGLSDKQYQILSLSKIVFAGIDAIKITLEVRGDVK